MSSLPIEHRVRFFFAATSVALLVILGGMYWALQQFLVDTHTSAALATASSQLEKLQQLVDNEQRAARWLFGSLAAAVATFCILSGFLLRRILAHLRLHQADELRLQHANQVLESLLDNIPAMVFAKEATELRFVRFNRAGERLLGLARVDLIGKSDRDLFPAEQADAFIRKDREVLAQTDVLDIPAEEIDTRDGGRRILHTRKVPIRGADGRPSLLLGISMDITEQKAAERSIRALNEAVRERNALLEASNRELESFCYSVSHDLRAPLRAINGFTRLLQDEYSARMDDDGLRYMRTIANASERMGRLIDELLEFSRLGRQSLELDVVDMQSVAHRALIDATTGRVEPEPNVTIAKLPRIQGDRRMLHLLWLNLLDNAVKYSTGVEAPHIEVWSEITDQEVTFHVRDNGIGFDMEYYDKLFGVFERLHSNPAYPGTGVGLAISHRVVTRHGGRIWARSEPGKGSTFSFALPRIDQSSLR